MCVCVCGGGGGLKITDKEMLRLYAFQMGKCNLVFPLILLVSLEFSKHWTQQPNQKKKKKKKRKKEREME